MLIIGSCLGRIVFFCLYGLSAVLGLTAVVYGQEIPLPLAQIKPFFPEADGLGKPRGRAPAVPVYADEILIGYVFETNDVVRIPGYSGKPINLRVGINTQGKITGAQILEHHEPILKIGVSEKTLENFTKAYVGKSLTDRVLIGSGHRQGYSYVDGISGATVTAMVINEIIMRAARKIATAHHILGSPLLQASEQTSAPALEAPRFEGAEPLWVQMWRQQVFQIIVLGMGLMFLTLILIFQDWLVRRPRLLFHVRTGFLLYTLFFIGWYTLAQLSVIQVLTFLKALFGDFRWDAFLIDPLIFILWAFVAVSLLLWGRGIFCGWLCPFGALQELTNDMAHSLKIRQFELPFMVHERLWALKYIILLILFGLSLQTLDAAQHAAEIEPFKTAIILRFQREWGFILYALGLIAISLVNRKFFCRYLCPLGAALAIPARIRLFDWLKRHKECGKPCQICAQECEVQAIHPTGEINPNECHYCLTCQVNYWDDQKCPPMVGKRKRRDKAKAARQPLQRLEKTMGKASGLDIGEVHPEDGSEKQNLE